MSWIILQILVVWLQLGIIQWILFKPSLFGANFCVQNRQLFFFLYRYSTRNIVFNKEISYSKKKYHIQQGNIVFNKEISYSTRKYCIQQRNIIFNKVLQAPGTGKTLLMRALAGEYPELTFIRITASDLISKYMGEPEK
jgi:hypothetical protein